MTDLPPPPPPSGYPPPPPPTPYSGPPPGYTATYGAPSPVSSMQYAGFWARFAALLIDGFIIGLFFIPAVVVLQTGPTELSECTVDSSGNVTFGDGVSAVCEGPTGGTIAMSGILGLVGLAAGLVYVAKLEGGPSGQSLGKRALGIRTVDANTGGPIGPGRAIGRFLFRQIISGNVCLLGYLWALWDPRKQSWHDKVVTSVVVRA